MLRKKTTCYYIIDCVLTLVGVGGDLTQRGGCLALAVLEMSMHFLVKIKKIYKLYNSM